MRQRYRRHHRRRGDEASAACRRRSPSPARRRSSTCRAPGARSRSTTRPCGACRASAATATCSPRFPGVQTNNNNVNTGPVFAIFPIHGGRGVESRLTVDGLNISNPPGGNQPPNFTADIGNAQEVTMTTSGGLGEMETAGLTMNIVPKQGGNTPVGPVLRLRLLEGDAVGQLHRRAAGARRHAADAGVPRLRRQRGRSAARS